MSDVVLDAQNLTKQIRGKHLVENVSFQVRRGEVFGFLGPNGAGKTTTIRMLTGLAKPTSGSIHIGGFDLRGQFPDAIARVGCIVENPQFYGYLTGRENLFQCASLIDTAAVESIDQLGNLVGLTGRLDDKVRTYSLGMRQRLGIAQALLGEPELLILDEPTNGLDPSGIRELRVLIRSLADSRGMGVLVSSHLLSEIQLLCDRVGILHRGKLIHVAGVDELMRGRDFLVSFTVGKGERVREVVQELAGASCEITQQDDGSLSFRAPLRREQVAEMSMRLVQEGIPIYAIGHAQPTLEELFMELTGGETGDELAGHHPQ